MQTHRIDSLTSGSELHGYIIDRVLGSGAFGITYLARHQHLETVHVIKEYLPDCAMREHGRSTDSPKSTSDKDLFAWGLKCFFDEAKLLHQLRHPHIVTVTDLFVANGTAAGVPVGPAPAPSLSTMTLTSLNGLPDIVLTQGDPVVIGRDPRQAQIVLDNPKISGQHALVRYDGRQLLVEDLQSTNGTFLSGQRMNKPKAMSRGDVLHLSSAPEGVGYVIKGAKPGPVATLVPLDPRLTTIALKAGQRIAVGRGPDNNVIIDDPHLSALHCRMQAQADGTVVVEDSRTTNGTFVDSIENRIDTATLKPGQKLCLGVKDVVYELKAGKE